jgi:hypothetical protein
MQASGSTSARNDLSGTFRSKVIEVNCLFQNLSGYCSSVAFIDRDVGGGGTDAVGAVV